MFGAILVFYIFCCNNRGKCYLYRKIKGKKTDELK